MVRCRVISCKSDSERKIAGVSFHSFPDDPDIRKKWIEATGRKNWTPTKYCKICSKHFPENALIKKMKKTLLYPGAIPNLVDFGCSDIVSVPATPITLQESCKFSKKPLPTQSNDPEPSTSANAIVQDCTLRVKGIIVKRNAKRKLHFSNPSQEEDTPRKRKLKSDLKKKSNAVQGLRKKVRAVQQTNRRLLKRNAYLKDVISDLKLKCLISHEDADVLNTIDSANRDFLKRFVGVARKSDKYSPSLRKFALCLHFISPRAYSYVREQFNTCLPHPQTLISWYRSVDGKPGFTSESLQAIKTKVDSSSKQIYACLSFDEMSIRKSITLESGECVGAVNIGSNLDGDNIRMATQALVFMATSLNHSWKIPVGYFLIESVTAEQKAQLVTKCIKLLYSCNVNVISITCDGCPSNFAMAKVLGCNIENEEVDPVFKVDIDGVFKEVCFFPDPPHMIKLVRNLLGSKGILKTESGEEIKWAFIKALHNLQEQEGLHLANKLRKAHIDFYKQIMKVKLAAQTFSNSVANAIEFCKDLELEDFQDSCAQSILLEK